MHNPHLHLLIDDHEIAYRRGLTRFIERPHRVQSDPVLTADHPWEQTRINLWGSVYWDGREDCFRMWYLADNKGRRNQFENSLCHATSPDGVTWTRGAYTHVDHPDGVPNSVVYGERRQPEVRRLGPPTVLIDPLEPDPNRRYKLVAFFIDHEDNRGYVVAFSPDGIHWNPAPSRVHLPRGDRTCVMQDFKRGGFAMTTRHDHALRDRTAGHAFRRDIAISRSDDLLTWTPSSVIVDADHDDPPATEFYGMPFFNWGNQYVGLLEYYDPINEILNVQLTSSRDGIRWERALSRQTYFDVGRQTPGTAPGSPSACPRPPYAATKCSFGTAAAPWPTATHESRAVPSASRVPRATALPDSAPDPTAANSPPTGSKSADPAYASTSAQPTVPYP